ncbi:F-box only protein 21-like [Daphnia pulex]|uniref:F-box only protein 21-like n=1 Tax=Daphnia pulex TaxID=6669 RepID=UPI001EDCF32E|nr:F-box only protein 21-like [Daphnia pulex]XP_046442922.1 F-box only protein 21-like [Daphnia pulex]
MSLLSLPNEVLICYIFSLDTISISDLQSLMVSCRPLYNIIRESDELWRLKFIQRWGNFLSQTPNCYENVWFEWTTMRLKKAKEVQKAVQNMSSVAYPLGQSPLIVINKLIAESYPIPISEYVQNELEEIIYDKKIRQNKTTLHYAKDVLVKVRMSILDKKWRDFMAQPESRKSLFEGVALLSQWSTLGHGKGQTCLKDLESSVEKITDRVKQLLELEVGKVSCASTDDPKKKNLKILDSINQVMFNELGFKKFPDFYTDRRLYSNFQQAFERKEGCPAVLCAIYQEVAWKMGILCEAVYCNKNDRENNLPNFIIMNRPLLLLRWKDSAGSEDDSIYIDVFRGGYLNQSSLYPSLREQPAVSVDSVLFRMQEVLTYFRRHQYDEIYGLERMRDNLSFYVRLGCSMSPQDPNRITRYAEHCIRLGIQLDDAIQLLQNYFQSPEFKPFIGYYSRSPSKMLEECISKLNEQKAEIAAAKTVHHRPSSLKFSVGLVVICNYKKWGRNCRKPCVIVSWNVKFQESNEWKSKATSYSFSNNSDEESQDQPHYHILMVDSDESNPHFQLNVPEETLELLPAAVPIEHDKIWVHFERFDGRRYLPNAEKRAQFPEDEAVTLSLIG